MATAPLLGATSLTAPAAAQSADALQDWLAANARPVRTVAPEGEDFSDLEPLAAAIGAARVVQLGEPSHNAGSCFSAKVRLVKFLHQRLGFDVVIWESGIYDVALVEAGLRAGEKPAAAARRGILQNWSWNAECLPLFVYAQQSHATARPLAMAGFDSSMTSPFANLARELRDYAAGPARAALRREAVAATEEVIQAFNALTRYVEGLDAINASLTRVAGAPRREALARWERETGAPLRPNRAMLERFQAAQGRLAEILRANDGAFATFAGTRRSGFLRRVVESLGARGSNLYERFGSDVTPPADGGLAGEESPRCPQCREFALADRSRLSRPQDRHLGPQCPCDECLLRSAGLEDDPARTRGQYNEAAWRVPGRLAGAGSLYHRLHRL